jgi:release factor glutamine methyltransferase
LTRSNILSEKEVSADIKLLIPLIDRINLYEPIQYILNEEYFFGRKFYVDPSVLIPRPETEELITHVLSTPLTTSTPAILDVGTGSGCIAITLALEIPNVKVFATDISEEALTVADRNNSDLSAKVSLRRHDILNELLPFEELDWIVSNPPYISSAEKETMHQNVLAYEPHLALFAGNDPLIFYKKIVEVSWRNLKREGRIVMEINESLGRETANIFSKQDFAEIRILKDFNKKDRFVSAIKK